MKSISRMVIWGSLALIPLAGAATDQPNILIIMGDDATYSDLPMYGGENVDTPNLDRLSREGMIFERAYVSMSMCAPCRAELNTGKYPLRNGAAWNHGHTRKGTRSLPHYLKELGYRVGLSGKTHLMPISEYPFEIVKGAETNCVADTSDFHPEGIREFINRDHSQPFSLTVALTTPHVPWTVGDPGHFDPETLKLPPHLADTADTRREFAKYLAEIEVLDQQVGQTLKLLAESGQAGNTLVIFTSEQGAQFPGCKWTNWSAGVHTGLVVRWPGHVVAGTRTDALVQYCDILPTLIEAASGDPSGHGFDGSSFIGVLKGTTSSHRDYVYFLHNNIPEGPAYPVRGISDGRFHYIRNLESDRLFIEKHIFGLMEHSGYMPSYFFASYEQPQVYALLQRYMNRPPEELYDNWQDPHQMHSIIETNPEVKNRLSKALDEWMRTQGDPGSSIDTLEAFNAAREQKHLY